MKGKLGRYAIEYKGVWYTSEKDCCEKLGKVYANIKNYKRKGMSFEEAMEYIPPSSEYELGGVVYSSKKEACRVLKVYVSTVDARLEKGWSKEEAFGLVKKDCIDVGGVIYSNVAEACKILKKDPKLVNSRLYNGWSLDEAFDIVERKKQYKGKKVPIGGVEYPNLRVACEVLGKDYKVVYSRIHTLGYSYDEAFDIVERESKDSFEYKGVTYRNLRHACDELGLNINTVQKRISGYGYSREEALDMGADCKFISIDLGNKKYKSLYSFCRDYGLNYSSVTGRINKNGYSVLQAVGIEPYSVDGVIVKGIIGSGVSVISYTANNYYKCLENGKIKYYSKDELIKIRRKAFENGERF